MQSYDFENKIGFIINSVASAFVRAFDTELHKRSGVTIGQWKVMVVLVRQDGLTQKEITDRLTLKPLWTNLWIHRSKLGFLNPIILGTIINTASGLIVIQRNYSFRSTLQFCRPDYH